MILIENLARDMPINWEDKHDTGNKKIDDQHRLLFRFTNKLENLLGQREVEPAELEQLMRFLQMYVSSHFRYEEVCMLKNRCPAAKKNRESHQQFLEFLQNSTQSYETHGFSFDWLRELHGFIRHWLDDHICGIDTQLRHCHSET